MCNVDLAYEKLFKNLMTKEEYYDANYKSCELLKSEKFKNKIIESEEREIFNINLLKNIEKLAKQDIIYREISEYEIV